MDVKKFLNKYRISSTRLSEWDYGSVARYFVTICTRQKLCYFGTIKNEEIVLSEIGEIVRIEWLKTPVIRHDMNLILDEFVVMPNHFHGILIIGQNKFNNTETNDRICCGDGRDAMHGVSTTKQTTTKQTTTNHPPSKNHFCPQIKNLSSIIRGFKSAVTINARKINPDFEWQERFHDHIILSDRAFYRIRNYIIDNPKKWDIDKYNR